MFCRVRSVRSVRFVWCRWLIRVGNGVLCPYGCVRFMVVLLACKYAVSCYYATSGYFHSPFATMFVQF